MAKFTQRKDEAEGRKGIGRQERRKGRMVIASKFDKDFVNRISTDNADWNVAN